MDFGAYHSAFDPLVMRETLETFADEPDVGALLIVMTPQPAMEHLAEIVRDIGSIRGVPALLCNKAGSMVRDQLEADALVTGYPIYSSLDDCYRVLEALMAYRQFQDEGLARETGNAPAGAIDALASKLPPGLLTEPEAKSLLAAVGVPVTSEIMCPDVDAAVQAARKIGFPVVLKGVARGLIHKSDAGAVKLNIPDVAAVRSAFAHIQDAISDTELEAAFQGSLVAEMAVGGVAEAFVGSAWDPQHGSGVLVGAGGVFVEVVKDVNLAAAPVSMAKAQAMIESLQTFPLFDGARGRPKADVAALADIVHRVSLLAAHLGPRLKELDVNPVIVRAAGEGALAVDARAVWTITD